MTLIEFFDEAIGVGFETPVEWCFLAFTVLWLVSDFLHVFFTACFSWFNKK